MNGNPLAAYPWLHLAANLTALALRLCCGAFILALAYRDCRKTLKPENLHF